MGGASPNSSSGLSRATGRHRAPLFSEVAGPNRRRLTVYAFRKPFPCHDVLSVLRPLQCALQMNSGNLAVGDLRRRWSPSASIDVDDTASTHRARC